MVCTIMETAVHSRSPPIALGASERVLENRLKTRLSKQAVPVSRIR